MRTTGRTVPSSLTADTRGLPTGPAGKRVVHHGRDVVADYYQRVRSVSASAAAAAATKLYRRRGRYNYGHTRAEPSTEFMLRMP